jgi:hypothetical protein
MSKSGFKVPIHVAVYSIMFAPAVIFLLYYDQYGHQEEELEEQLKANHGDSIRRSQAGNKNMAAFFNSSIRNPDGAMDNKIDSVLKGGKGEMKRHYAVDEKLYGTAEGVAERKRMEKELKRQKREKKKKRLEQAAGSGAGSGTVAGDEDKKKKTEESATSDDTLVTSDDETLADPKAQARQSIQVDATQIAAVTLVAGAAALVGFLAGGSRRS